MLFLQSFEPYLDTFHFFPLLRLIVFRFVSCFILFFSHFSDSTKRRSSDEIGVLQMPSGPKESHSTGSWVESALCPP